MDAEEFGLVLILSTATESLTRSFRSGGWWILFLVGPSNQFQQTFL